MSKNIQFHAAKWFTALPSTNTWLVEQVMKQPALPSGTVVAARAQTAGRGRQQRAWVAEPGRNLTFSFLWNAPVAERYVPAMALAIAVGIAAHLARQGLVPTIKWPNDVLVDDKKIAGILCERVSTGGEAVTIVAGIGLNVNMNAEEAAAVDQPATSLALETGRAWEVEEVLDGLLQQLEAPLHAWATGGFPAIADTYQRFAHQPGARIAVRDGDTRVEGTLVGFTDDGALRLVAEDSGAERILYSGDIAAN